MKVLATGVRRKKKEKENPIEQQRSKTVTACRWHETGAYYTEWSKPERKTPIQYTNAYIWNLERW